MTISHVCRKSSFAYQAYKAGRTFMNDMPRGNYPNELVDKVRLMQQGMYFAEWYDAENEPLVPLRNDNNFNIETGLFEPSKRVLDQEYGSFTYIEENLDRSASAVLKDANKSKIPSENTQRMIDSLLEIKRVQLLGENFNSDFETERKAFLDDIKHNIKSEPESCSDCVLCDGYEDYPYYWCNHPMSNGYEISSSEINTIPAWCKLRTTNLTIRIKGV